MTVVLSFFTKRKRKIHVIQAVVHVKIIWHACIAFFYSNSAVNSADNWLKHCCVFWQADVQIKKLQIYFWCTYMLHRVLHNWHELHCSQQAEKILTLGSILDLLNSVRGYRNISFKDKVILNKNQKIHSEFITASNSYITYPEFPITWFKQNLNPIPRRNHKF